MRRALVALAVCITAFSFTTLPSRAGTNGQQIQYNVGCNANWSETTGENQNGRWSDEWVNTPAADPYNYCSQSPYYSWGWWWVGGVDIEGWWSYDGNQGSGDQGYQGCNVPQYQDYDDWTQCHTPS